MTPNQRQRNESTKRSDLAYVAIRGKLIRGALRPGERLDINTLVDEFQTSRQPVLAAITRLSTEGLLRIVPQVGCWVVQVGADEVADFFRFFALTEGLACSLAAMRRKDSHLTDLQANHAAVRRLLDVPPDSDSQAKRFFSLNREFHGLIHSMAQSEYVATHAGAMWDRCDFYLASADPHIQGERIAESETEHEAIAAAIVSADSSLAGRLMEEHIASFGKVAVERLRRASN